MIFPRTMMPDWEQKKASVVLLCDDADATFRELSGRGVVFIDPPKKMPFGTFGVFTDIDGNQLAINVTKPMIVASSQRARAVCLHKANLSFAGRWLSFRPLGDYGH